MFATEVSIALACSTHRRLSVFAPPYLGLSLQYTHCPQPVRGACEGEGEGEGEGRLWHSHLCGSRIWRMHDLVDLNLNLNLNLVNLNLTTLSSALFLLRVKLS